MSCFVSILSAATALGPTLPASRAAYLADLSPHVALDRLLDRAAQPIVAAEIPGLPGLLAGERIVALAGIVARAAAPALPGRFDLLLALPRGRAGLPPDLAARAREAVGAALPEGHRIEASGAVAENHAAAPLALGHARRRVAERGGAVVVLAADSLVCPDAVETLEAEERLKTAHRPHGVIPGEAAALALVAGPRPDERNAMRLRGAAAAAREIDYVRSPQRGETLSRVIRDALGPGDEDKRERIGLVTDLNGEPWRADELGMTITRLAYRYEIEGMPTVIANRFGDTGAAAGLLGLAALQARYDAGQVAAPAACCCASAASGLRAAAAIDFIGPGEREPTWLSA